METLRTQITIKDASLRLLLFLCLVSNAVGFKLTILHTNDVHSRFVEFNKYGSDCSQSDSEEGKCFGGVARRFTKIEEIRRSHDNVLLLDAGDQFMGTTWFTVYEGNASAYFMNQLQYDAMCLGNHEFDIGVKPVANFVNSLNFDVVSANLDVSNEPLLKDKISKSVTKTVNGEQVGIIGYITPETVQIANPGPTVGFTDVVEAVKEQVQILKAANVNKIIAIGHAGITVDQQVAAIDGVDLVIGGHSNTFLYNGEAISNEDIQGPYPMVISQPGGGRGLVVQDYTWGKYLGYLNLTFGTDGVVTEYAGNPILLDKDVVQDPTILQSINEWGVQINELNKQQVGYSKVFLQGSRQVCRMRECNLGNLITDAIISFHANYSHPSTQWAPAAIALTNSGGIRGSIDKGIVTMGEVITVQPFRNEIDLVTITGSNLRAQLEHSVSDWIPEDPAGQFLQMSGVRVQFDISAPVGQRLISAQVRCLECEIPEYYPLKDNENYKMFISTFMLGGGDGFTFEPLTRQSFNTLDSTTLRSYINKHSPLYAGLEGRIQYVAHGTGGGSIGRSSSLKGASLVALVIVSFFSTLLVRL